MAHEFESGFFVSEPAWHGLGTVLQDPPTMAEALQVAGLDWKVELQRLTRPDGSEVPSRAVVRSTDQTLLGVVGPDYEPLQNSDALAWFQPFVDSGTVRLEAAGSLREGRRVWVLGRVIGSAADVVKRDRIDQFILMANGHDGTLSVRLGLTTVRVVCQNTLTAALGNSSLLSIRHTKGAAFALKEAQEYIASARAAFAESVTELQALGAISCSDYVFRQYVRDVFELQAPAEGEEDGSRIMARVVELFQSGKGSDIPGVRGTFWGAFNAVTEYVTHERGKTNDSRVDSLWFGQGAQLTARALRVALKYA